MMLPFAPGYGFRYDPTITTLVSKFHINQKDVKFPKRCKLISVTGHRLGTVYHTPNSWLLSTSRYNFDLIAVLADKHILADHLNRNILNSA